MSLIQEQHPDPARWWRHRRRGYYWGIGWGIGQTIMWACIEVQRPGFMVNMGAVVGWSYGMSVTLIVAYFGNTTAETWVTKGAK